VAGVGEDAAGLLHLRPDVHDVELDAALGGLLGDPLGLTLDGRPDLLLLKLAVLQPPVENSLLLGVVDDAEHAERLIERPRGWECGVAVAIVREVDQGVGVSDRPRPAASAPPSGCSRPRRGRLLRRW